MTPFVTAGAGFLLAVLWFDLMFDVQTLRHPRDRPLPEGVLASIAGYYGRVTTEARPMNRLVGLVMVAAITAIALQVAGDDVSDGVGWASLGLLVAPVVLAAGRVFPNAVRLGTRQDSIETQSRLARRICCDHLFCLASVITLLVIQLALAR